MTNRELLTRIQAPVYDEDPAETLAEALRAAERRGEERMREAAARVCGHYAVAFREAAEHEDPNSDGEHELTILANSAESMRDRIRALQPREDP